MYNEAPAPSGHKQASELMRPLAVRRTSEVPTTAYITDRMFETAMERLLKSQAIFTQQRLPDRRDRRSRS